MTSIVRSSEHPAALIAKCLTDCAAGQWSNLHVGLVAYRSTRGSRKVIATLARSESRSSIDAAKRALSANYNLRQPNYASGCIEADFVTD
jgi:hypothetical protein